MGDPTLERLGGPGEEEELNGEGERNTIPPGVSCPGLGDLDRRERRS